MTRIGLGDAIVFAGNETAETYSAREGRYELRRLTDPTDAAALLMGAICIGHEFGQEGIAFSVEEARSLATMLVKAADECDALKVERKAGAS